MAAATEVREGFLCPMCMKDLGNVTMLQGHFEEEHSTEDKDVLQQLRGLFGKAKKKILGEKDEAYESSPAGIQSSVYTSPSSGALSGYDPSMWEPQELGGTRSWTDLFKAQRGAKVDRYVVETNKLIIRLDKLTGPDVPMEANKRRAHEKSVVQWMPDSHTKECPYCRRSFTLMRRRHHCRLCGDIMCDKCSQFLPYTFAKKLTDPAFQNQDIEVGFLRRTGSNSSLNSILGPEGDPHIRTCEKCRKLLERRNEQIEQRTNKPTVVLLYERLKSCVVAAEELLTKYMPMVESLSCGESMYRLQEAQRYRVQITKLYETIDGLSKKILNLGLNNEEEPSQKQLLLQRSIRAFATNFMQDNMLGLQALPSEEQYLKLQEERKLEIQKRIAAERQATFEAQQREKKAKEQREQKDAMQRNEQLKQAEARERSGSQKLAGWIPNESSHINFNNTDDPMIQQMNIIRSYIKQAKQAGKLDEVQMLEQNLKELQNEYLRQQRQNWS
ncbi:rabenosyn-5-like [Crassostrea virginica]